MTTCGILLNTGENLLLNDDTYVLLNEICELVVFNGGGSKKKLHIQQRVPVYLEIPVYSGLTAHNSIKFNMKSALKDRLNTQIIIKSSIIDKIKGIFHIKSALNDRLNVKLVIKGKQNDKKFYDMMELMELLD